ncbi:hypothetical protein PHJA_003006600, partial [Phtheirospermum japonicum]
TQMPLGGLPGPQILILTRHRQHFLFLRKTTRTKITIVQIHPRTLVKMSTTSSPAASQTDPSSGSLDPIFHLIRTFPFSFLRPFQTSPSHPP